MTFTCLNSPPILFCPSTHKDLNCCIIFSPSWQCFSGWTLGRLGLLRNKMACTLSKWIMVLLVDKKKNLLLVKFGFIIFIWNPPFCLLQTLFLSLFSGLDVSIFYCEVCEISKHHLGPILDPQQVPNSSSDSGIENTNSSTYDSNPVSSDLDLPIALRKKLEAVPSTHLPISSHSINYHINIKFF